MKKLSIFLVLGVSLIAACGPNGGNNGGGNNGATITPEEFSQQLPTEYAEAACKSAFQCPENQNPAFMLLLFGGATTQQECVDELTSDTSDAFASGDLESGLVQFDPQAAQQCLNEVQLRSSGNACDIAFGATAVPSSCMDAIQGTLEVGDECASDSQCASSSCNPAAIAGSCTGECVETAAAGEACGDPSTQEGPRCRSNLVCVPDGSGSFRCVQQGGLTQGEACGSSFASLTACAGGLYCAGEQGSETCQPATPVEAGGDCSADGSYCEAGYVCLEGTCSEPAGPGEPCSGSSLVCAAGTYCDFDAEECTPTKDAGASCDGASECSGNLECAEGACAAPEQCTLPMN